MCVSIVNFKNITIDQVTLMLAHPTLPQIQNKKKTFKEYTPMFLRNKLPEPRIYVVFGLVQIFSNSRSFL